VGDGTGVVMADDQIVCWTEGSSYGDTKDLCLYRSAAGKMKILDGLGGNMADLETDDVYVNTVNAETGTVDYMDVESLEMQFADLAVGSCTANQVRIDNGGATMELCFCVATNTWWCASLDNINGPTD
jgi:hypothetical protein